MKFFPAVLFSCLILVFTNSFSQSRLLWSTTIAHPNAQITDCKILKVDEYGNSFTINYTKNSGSNYFTYIFNGFNASGNKIWEYLNDSCLANCSDAYFHIIPIENNGAIFIGFYEDQTGTQLRLKRISKTGGLLWQQYWLTPFLSAVPVQSLIDNSGNLVVGITGVVDSTTLEDFAVAQFDTTNGFLNWHIELPDDGTIGNPLMETLSSIAIDANDNIYGCGTGVGLSLGVVKNYYFKISSLGTLDYRNQCAFSGLNTSVNSIKVNTVNDFYLMGMNTGDVKIEKRKTQTGNLVRTSTIHRDSADVSNVGFELEQNSIIVLNNYRYFNILPGTWTNKHYMATSLDTAGNVNWTRDYFATTDSLGPKDGTQGAIQLSKCNGNFYVLSTQHFTTSRDLLILHKLALTGNTLWSDTTATNNSPGNFDFDSNCDSYLGRTFSGKSVVQRYSDAGINYVQLVPDDALFEIYPNPASDRVTIKLTSRQKGNKELVCFNGLGSIVKQEAFDRDDLTFSVADLPGGVYFLQLVIDKQTASSKILVKQ